MRSRRLRCTRWRVIALAMVLTAAGCSSGSAGNPPATTTSAVTSLLPAVTTHVAEGPSGPRLSWDPIDGASDYSVQVADDDGPTWMWVGAETNVEFGTLPTPGDGPAEALDQAFGDEVAFDPNVKQRWLVTAFDSDGNVLAMSPISELDVPG